MAAETANLEIIQLLLSSGAKVNATTLSTLDTPLFYAPHCPDTISLLIKGGADVKATNREGVTYDKWDGDLST